MKAFQEGDPDGNGKADTIPMMTDLGGMNNALMGAYVEGGNSNWLDPADNKIKPVELAPGYQDYLAKMADWYQKGYIYKEAFAKFDPLELLKTNRVGTSSMWYSRITLLFPQIKPNLPEGADYAIAKDLTGPAGKLMTASRGNTTGMLITKSQKSGSRHQIHQPSIQGFADQYAECGLREKLEVPRRPKVRDRAA